MKGISIKETAEIKRPVIIIFFEPIRSIQRPKKSVARVNVRKYTVCIWPMDAEEAPMLSSSRGTMGEAKLIPKARRKTVIKMERSDLFIDEVCIDSLLNMLL